MCGLAGIFNPFKAKALFVEYSAQQLVSQMCGTISHRGPDDEGIWEDKKEGITFGHRRLSIIDLSTSGHQPMHINKQDICITYNGEIYNYIELRENLLKKGYKFIGTSDTEVLLNLFLDKSYHLFDQLDGMFAFAIWDGRTQSLFLARDCLGEKPLYYTMYENTFLFASEIKALLKVLPKEAIKIREASLAEYLTLGYVGDENTIYENIRELLPGHYLTVNKNLSIKEKRYWNPEINTIASIGFNEALEKADYLLQKSIERRLRADVEVGVFLSGGIDSGLITSYAAEISPKISSFCVGVSDKALDERKLAQEVSKRYHTKHHELYLDDDLYKHLPSIFSSYDDPIADASIIPSYLVSKLASRSLKVILVGDGGDEVFGGYRRYVSANLKDYCLKFLSANQIKSISKGLESILPYPSQSRSMYAFIYRLLKSWSFNDVESYIYQHWEAFDINSTHKILSIDYKLKLKDHPISYLLEKIKSRSELRKSMFLDLFLELPGDLLVKMDIASMAHSLETRAPFLDKNIAEFGLTLPNSFKISGLKTKSLLRALAEKRLPSSIVYGSKKGFEVPITQWLQGPLKKTCYDLLLSNSPIIKLYFNKVYVEKLLDNAFNKNPTSLKKVWILFSLALWYEHRRL